MSRSATIRSVAWFPNASSAGFTFVELLIVVAIVSILAAISLPAYRQYELRAEVAESLTFLGDAKSAVNEFYSRWGRMPANNSEAGLRSPGDLHGRYVRSVSVSNGVMVASMELASDLGDGHAVIRTLTFRPWVDTKKPSNPIVWSCGSQDPKVADNYEVIGGIAGQSVDISWLPSVCKG